VRLAARLVLHARFDADAVLADVAGRGVTVLCGVPTMFQALLAHPEAGRLGSAALKFCNSGGAPAPVEVLQRFAAATGCRILEGWGMTETSGTGTFTPVDAAHRPGSCGLPVPGLDLKLVDIADAARTVPRGERGEVCVRGPNVTSGYWRRDAAADGVYTPDGYLRTGDVGYLDADGYLYLVDRTKDMLLCSGYNVYPRTIEEAVYEHPAVAECCVIGIPDAYRGQAPKAFVVLRPGAAGLELAELQAFLADRLGRHEIVAALELRATLPRTPVGKLSKQALYAEEAARAAARVD
jgi:long-chain acyl-CoA synthetase